MQSEFDNNFLNYFTDVEHLRGMFKEYVAATSLPKRMIVIHGVGGVGKSSLLRMFRIHCKSGKTPVALASGDDAKSAFDVITRWMEDLKVDGVKFSSLSKTIETYRAIQAKVENQAKKTQTTSGRMADIASKAASKTAETAGGALLGAAIGSVIPGVGTAVGGALGGVLSGMGAEALTDWLRGFLTKPDIDLLLDPAKRLTTDFLVDIAKAAEKKRIVLLLDTYEQMTALEDWVGDVAQKIHPNILMVVAGRKFPDWNRIWQGWVMNAQVEELKPMTEEIMRDLISRYYATMRGGKPDPVQVEAIIRFARGLPMVITSAVQLWVEYGVEDFQVIKPEIVANLVDRLIEGVPKALIPALESAAVVRWFDQPILRAITGVEDVRDFYNELRRFPFVLTRVEGLALHDSVREMIDENLRIQDSERHSELHERAIRYFEKRLENATSEDTEKLQLERLYHRIRANEKMGIKLFQETAEGLSQYGLWSQLSLLLNDVNNYPLNYENSRLWREFYNGRLISAHTQYEEAIQHFERISQNSNAENKLRLYSLGELGGNLSAPELLAKPGYADKASLLLEQASISLPREDLNSINYYYQNIVIHRRLSHWQKVSELYTKFPSMIETLDENRRVHFIGSMKDLFGSMGNWREFLNMQENIVQLAPRLQSPYTRIRNLTHWIFIMLWMGRYAEVERICREGLKTYLELGHDDVMYLYRNIAYTLALQNKFQEAEMFRQKFFETQQKTNTTTITRERSTAIAYSFWGPTKTIEGNYEEARCELLYSLIVKRRVKDVTGYPELFVGLGILYETKQEYSKAAKYYNRCIRLNIGRRNFESAALIGLVRVNYANGDYASIPQLLVEAEQVAQKYEYNDHLASLQLTQGHLAWENGTQNEALTFYQKAMIYALRYNRFLLDELLSGRSQGTPLQPIIPYCLKRGEDGHKILIVLRDWWRTFTNDTGIARPDTISPIPESIPLLEAEQIARKREIGDGSPQREVVEQIENALKRKRATNE